jgi:hypothetical protein
VRLADERRFASTDYEMELALAEAFRARVLVVDQDTATPSDTVGGPDAWDTIRGQIRELVLTSDPSCFLSWQPIRGTMFVDRQPYTLTELEELVAATDWASRWSSLVVEDLVGSPALIGRSMASGNLIHHAYHLMTLESHLGTTVSEFDEIIEVGGGYGSFARLVYSAGFESAYKVYDLPEFCALQEFYLASVADSRKDSSAFSGFSTQSSLKDLRFDQSSSRKLFLAFWSMSEMPTSIRAKLVEVMRQSDVVMIAYQELFGGVNNTTFFDDLFSELDTFVWQVSDISFLPGQRYAIGTAL